IAGSFKVMIAGRRYPIDQTNLGRILARPPSDPGIVEFRRGLLGEIARSEAARANFERVYVSLHQFRSLLETPPSPRRLDANRRRLEILASVKSAIDHLADSFEGVEEGLARMRDFGVEVRASEGYERLRDLLDYHENLSTID